MRKSTTLWAFLIIGMVTWFLVLLVLHHSNSNVGYVIEPLKFVSPESTPSVSRKEVDNYPKHSALLKYCNLPAQSSWIGNEGLFDGAELSLVGIVTIFRHGDRGPLTPTNTKKEINCSSFVTEGYNNLEWAVKKYNSESLKLKVLPISDFCMPGLLSKQGASQLIELGSGLKEAYKKHVNFDDLHKNASAHITASSTPYSRTVQSLYSLLFGLLGPKSFLKIPIHTKADVAFCFKHCRCEAANYFEKQHKKDLRRRLKQTVHDFGTLSAHVKEGPLDLTKSDVETLLPSTLKDMLLTFVCHNQTPSCANNPGCRHSDDLFDRFLQHEANVSASGFNLRKASILRAYGLMSNIDHNVASWISHHKLHHSLETDVEFPVKFLFYSGHDLTLMYLLSSLSIYSGFLPNYASRFIIEIVSHNLSKQYFARLLYNGDDFTLNGCPTSSRLGRFCDARFISHHLEAQMQHHFSTNTFWEACKI